MVAVGFDPGWACTGYAVVDGSPRGLQVREVGLLRAAHRELSTRLRELYAEARSLLGEARVDLVALEDLYSHPQHPRTAVLLGHVRGVLCLAAAELGTPVWALAPSEVKRAVCGNGRAPKAQVQDAVRALLGVREELNVHAADALAVAATALVRAGFPLRGPVAGR